MCTDGTGLGSKLVSFAKGFSKHPHILAIFKVDSEYLRLPFRVKVNYFILHSILVYSFVILLIFFAMSKRRCTYWSRTVLSDSNVYMFKCKQKGTTAYQQWSVQLIFIIIFLEWSPFSYFSCYVLLGFTIRTVRTQNNHQGFEFYSSLQTCFPLWLIFSSAHKNNYKFLYMTTGKINVEKNKRGK